MKKIKIDDNYLENMSRDLNVAMDQDPFRSINSLVMDVVTRMSTQAQNEADQIKLDHLKKIAKEYFGTDDENTIRKRVQLVNVVETPQKLITLIFFDKKLQGSFNSYTSYPNEEFDPNKGMTMKIEVRNNFTEIPPIPIEYLKEMVKNLNFQL